MRKWTFLAVFTLSLTAMAVGFFIEPGEAAAPESQVAPAVV